MTFQKSTLPPLLRKMTFQKSTIFTLLLTILFAYVIQQALGFPFGSGLYPLVIASISLVLVLLQLSLELCGRGGGAEAVDLSVDESTKGKAAMKRAARFLFWILGFYATIWLMGFAIATILFFLLFMRLEGRIRWLLVIGLTVIASIMVLVYFPQMLGMLYPKGLLGEFVELPF